MNSVHIWVHQSMMAAKAYFIIDNYAEFCNFDFGKQISNVTFVTVPSVF